MFTQRNVCEFSLYDCLYDKTSQWQLANKDGSWHSKKIHYYKYSHISCCISDNSCYLTCRVYILVYWMKTKNSDEVQNAVLNKLNWEAVRILHIFWSVPIRAIAWQPVELSTALLLRFHCSRISFFFLLNQINMVIFDPSNSTALKTKVFNS